MGTLNRLFTTLGLVGLLALTGCGGGGGSAGTSPIISPNPGASAVTDLVIVLSSGTIPNTGTTNVTATVTSLDANRNALASVPVTLAVDNGAVVTITGASGSVTDGTGKLQASIGVGSSRANTQIVVTASALNGTLSRSMNLQVVEGTTGTVPSSVEVISGFSSVGTGGDGVLITAFVKDANNNAMVAAPVTFNATNGTFSSISAVTNAAGAATATFSAGANRNNRDVDIKVTSGTISKTLTLPVTGTKMSLSGPSSLVKGGTATFDIVVTDSKNNVIGGALVTATSSLGNTLAASVSPARSNSNGQISYSYVANSAGEENLVFTLVDSTLPTTVSPSPALMVSAQQFSFSSPAAGTKVFVNQSQVLTVQLPSATAGVPVNFAATGGILSAASAMTDASGAAQVSIASSSAGPVTVQATAVLSATSTASATLPLLITATTPSKLVLQISPTALAPNVDPVTGTNQAQVVARVTDANGNPVQGQTVNFTRVSDPSGGNLLQASSTTDSNGQAAVTYRSGAQSTASNGVLLGATTVATVVAGVPVPAVSGTANLTVNQNALFIALGTGNVITNLDPQTYQKDWVVYVTDSNGIPVNGATLTLKAIPTHYLTGQLAWDGVAWSYVSSIWFCRNEDANADGALQLGEDDNRDGVLWPGNVIAVTPGTVQTASGRATVSLIYAESYAPWVRMRLTATATVAGTESGTSVEFIVSGASSDFTVQANPPAGRVSPFGLLPKSSTSVGACTQTPP